MIRFRCKRCEKWIPQRRAERALKHRWYPTFCSDYCCNHYHNLAAFKRYRERVKRGQHTPRRRKHFLKAA